MDLPLQGSKRLQKRVRCSSLDGFLGEQHVSQTKGVDWMALSSSSSMYARSTSVGFNRSNTPQADV